ncbi:MAG: S8 family serine peptidase [Phenylobacterium sp.]|uniref:S8 family peptidase n=1 Tax=Phenylobacterium sp. TaxID=1871053 RepID=UPI0025D73F82|nr:S8 family peptidase [Phenylobacterium sp.]MBI1199758.1 S8 family serine peptidase [Phenylobacterium sp.]
MSEGPEGPTEPGNGLQRLDRDEINKTSVRYIISPKVFEAYEDSDDGDAARVDLIIEINLEHRGGRSQGQSEVVDRVRKIVADDPASKMRAPDLSRHHVFARLTRKQLEDLVAADSREAAEAKRAPAIYKVWPDRPLEAYLDRSVRIIKADACLRSFGSDGDGIVWAVADSGIEAGHAHFELHGNLTLPAVGRPPAQSPRPGDQPPLEHKDFTLEQTGWGVDGFGHGTHVAGIIAGICPNGWPDVAGSAGKKAKPTSYRVRREKDHQDRIRNRLERCEKAMQGVAPKAKLVSLKVLDSDGRGQESSLLAAIDYIARINDDGRWPRIHGLNLSLGYGFDAEWFAAGQSPLCVAVDRLVRQGVVVVAAAGNDGSAMIATENSPRGRRVGLDQTITDPGNAELAITVGSTHAEQPHTYGVSYFSSRGPTADGRPKPDIVAPGERIISAASPGAISKLIGGDPELKDAISGADTKAAYYREETGTSMAAPHVSGAIAAFLSVRSEFIGKPDRIKEILMTSATDLKRRRDFQGAGLLDLMRAIQSV